MAYRQAIALADLASAVPVTPETPVAVGSLTKSLTTLAVLQRVEQGRLALDAPVVRYLPDVRVADPRAARITLRQLRSHSAGLPASALFDGTQAGEGGRC